MNPDFIQTDDLDYPSQLKINDTNAVDSYYILYIPIYYLIEDKQT